MSDEYATAVALLFGAEPTDRALQGWRPRVWIALGNGVMPAKEWRDILRYVPSKYGIARCETVITTTPEGSTR